MKQIIILYRSKLRNKCKFYKNFFSLKSLKKSYVFFYIKYISTIMITSITCYYFVSTLEINDLYKSLIFGTLAFIQVWGFSNSTCAFINTFLSEYRESSRNYISFFIKTIIAHSLAELIFKLAFIIPVLIISLMSSMMMTLSIFLGIFIGLIMQWQESMKKLVKDYHTRLDYVISTLKFIIGTSTLLATLYIVFKVIHTVLQIIKLMVTTNEYSEEVLLNKFLFSSLDSISWLQKFFDSYGTLGYFFISILIILSIFNNLIKYKSVWEGRYIQKKRIELGQHLLFNEKAVQLPFIKMLKIDRIDSLFKQIKKQPEIIIMIIIEFLVLNYMKSDIHKTFFIICFYFISNSNYMRSMFIHGNKSFCNYVDRIDLYYWRLSGKFVITLYDEKLDLLLWSSKKITIMQAVISILLSLVFLENKVILILLSIFIIVINEYMHKFNANLVSFSGFFVFSNSCKSELRNIKSDENELIENKLHNLYKMPFTILPMIIIITDYIFSYISYKKLLIILIIFLTIAWIVDTQIKQYLKKGGKILEKINILD